MILRLLAHEEGIDRRAAGLGDGGDGAGDRHGAHLQTADQLAPSAPEI